MRIDGQQSAWKIAEPWAATLVAYREGSTAPDLERTLAELAANLDVTIDILEMHGAPDENHRSEQRRIHGRIRAVVSLQVDCCYFLLRIYFLLCSI